MEVELHIHLKYTTYSKSHNFINIQIGLNIILNILNKPYQIYFLSISIHIFVYTTNSKPLSFINMQIRLHIILNKINKSYQVYQYLHSHKWAKS